MGVIKTVLGPSEMKIREGALVTLLALQLRRKEILEVAGRLKTEADRLKRLIQLWADVNAAA